tara:strand:- start:567 stop:1151 length:585 start_codon:yes stop_codon:yes gene_type:complete
MLYLASKSPRRADLLIQMGIKFKVVEVNTAEAIDLSIGPRDNAEKISVVKCKHGAEQIIKDALDAVIISADTIVVLGNKIFGKPESKEHALSMLVELSGEVHSVFTGVSIGVWDKKSLDIHTISVETLVEFASISAQEYRKYIETDEPFDKAGAYGIQGKAQSFVKGIKGSYSNVVGLPIYETLSLLNRLGINY